MIDKIKKQFKNINFSKVELLEKGWSNDTKYYIEDKNNNKFLLRLSDVSLYDKKQFEFNLLKEVEKIGIGMPRPIEFGVIDNFVYLLLSWVDGIDAEKVILSLDEKTQYFLAVKAGKILREIHSIKIDVDLNWNTIFKERVEQKVKRVKNVSVHHEYLELFINYLIDNLELTIGRPLSILHSDYHLGNMLITRNSEISIIDFNKIKIGDPFYDFKQMIWTVRITNVFALGLIDGYTDFKPSNELFKLIKLYSIESCVGNIGWAAELGKSDIQIAIELFDNIYEDYEGLKLDVPRWYDKKLKKKYKNTF